MQKEITKELMRKAFCAYLPCSGRHKVTGDIVNLEGYSADTGQVEYWALKEHNDCDWGKMFDYQLILTPLSKISDEHALVLADILYGDQAYKMYEMMKTDLKTQWKTRALTSESVDFLRLKGYDCGFASIPSLIDAGIAIEESDINKKLSPICQSQQTYYDYIIGRHQQLIVGASRKQLEAFAEEITKYNLTLALDKITRNHDNEIILDAITYGFSYHRDSMNDNIDVPEGNKLQWLQYWLQASEEEKENYRKSHS